MPRKLGVSPLFPSAEPRYSVGIFRTVPSEYSSSVCEDGEGPRLVDVARCRADGTWARSTLFEGESCPSCPAEPDGPCDVEGVACVMSFFGHCVDENGDYEDATFTDGQVCEGGAWAPRWSYVECR